MLILAVCLVAGAVALALVGRHERRVRARLLDAGFRLADGRVVEPRPDATRPLPSRVERLP